MNEIGHNSVVKSMIEIASSLSLSNLVKIWLASYLFAAKPSVRRNF